MEHLWAPWRMEYITGTHEKGCIFCSRPLERERLAENLVLHVGKHAFVILNRFPYQSGHLMVVPLRHTDDFADLREEELAELFALLQEAVRALRAVYKAEGINLGMNVGRPAGAGIEEHIHFHVVPRWSGDTNFFPVIGGTKSMPELLGETYRKLRPWFEALEERARAAGGGLGR